VESSFDVSMLGYLVPQLLGGLPFLAGLILALVRRAQLTAAATGLTVAACVLGLLGVALSAWWGTFGFRMLFEGVDRPLVALNVVNQLLGLVHLAWLSLLVGAVFAGRRQVPAVRTAVPAPGSPL
jgi:hypothetical protein